MDRHVGRMMLHMAYLKKIFGWSFSSENYHLLKALQTRRVCNLFLLLSRHVGRMMLWTGAMWVEWCLRAWALQVGRCSRLALVVALVPSPNG